MPSHRQAYFRHAEYYASLLHALNDLYKRGGDSIRASLQSFDAEWLNIQAGQAWVSDHYEQDEKTSDLCSLYAEYGSYLLTLRQNPEQRIQWLKVALQAAQRIRRTEAVCINWGNLGASYYTIGDLQRAIRSYKEQLKIAEENHYKKHQASALGNLGLAYLSIGEMEKAVFQMEQALDLFREIQDRRGEGNTLIHLGSVYAHLRSIEKVIAYSNDGISIARELADRSMEGAALSNLGIAATLVQDYRQAIVYIEQWLAIDRELGYRRGEIRAMGNLGGVYSSLVSGAKRAPRYINN